MCHRLICFRCLSLLLGHAADAACVAASLLIGHAADAARVAASLFADIACR
jgi:hypothetical protein